MAKRYDAGWACIGWAPEFGGRGASAIEEVIWRQEESKYGCPRLFLIGQGMIAPTLLEQAMRTKRVFSRLPAARRCGASCFRSLPVARISRLRTRAERDGDGWLINGQKIWTSGAHFSDYGVIVCGLIHRAEAQGTELFLCR